MSDAMGQFVYQRQKLLLETQSGAQYNAPLLDLPQHPRNQGVANHGHTAEFSEVFESANVGRQFSSSNAAH